MRLKHVLTKCKGRSSTEEAREEDDTTVVEPDQNNGESTDIFIFSN